MEDVMVTGRMSPEKKLAGNQVLSKIGLNASQAVNLLYDRLAQEQDASFLVQSIPTAQQWSNAALLIDSLVPKEPIHSRFDNMTRGEIALDYAQSRKMV